MCVFFKGDRINESFTAISKIKKKIFLITEKVNAMSFHSENNMFNYNSTLNNNYSLTLNNTTVQL